MFRKGIVRNHWIYKKIKSAIMSSISSTNPVQLDPVSKAIQNALILDQVSKYTSINDMINCRSVNNLWKTQWTPVIQKHSKLQLCLTDKIGMLVKELQIGLKEVPNSDWENRAREYFCSMERKDADTKAKSIIKWISENIQNFPCSKVKVGTQSIKLVNKNMRSNFFRAISAFVNELVLEFSFGDYQFKSLGNLELEYINLKALEIHYGYNANDVEQLDMALRFFGNVIKHSPKLDTLSLVYRSSLDRFLTSCVAALPNPKQIKTLHISVTLTDNELQKLAKMNLCLRELRVSFEYFSKFSSETFKSFLSSQCDSLKELYLKCTLIKQHIVVITFPRMTMLEVLEIDFSHVGFRFPELNLQQSFPRIRKLKILNDENSLASFLDSNMQPVQSLDELDINALSGSWTVREACRIFPNIRRLSITCYKSYVFELRSITLNFLEEITLRSNCEYMQGDMNEILTGLWKRELAAAEKSGGIVEMQGEPYPFLQKIKTLRLVKGVLTDLVCIFGPMKLQSLQCLDLQITNPKMKHQISNAVLEKMREKFTVLL